MRHIYINLNISHLCHGTVTENWRRLFLKISKLSLVGIVLILFTPVMGFGVEFFFIGLILVLLAVLWAYFKTREVVALKEAIFIYKMKLYRIENKN